MKTKEELFKELDEVFEALEEEYKELPDDKKEEWVKVVSKGLDILKNKLHKLGGGDFVMTFGKHKGKPLKEVPASYLLWMYEQDKCQERNKDVYLYVKSKLKSLKEEAEQEKEAYFEAKRKEEELEESVIESRHGDAGDRD